MADYGFTLNMSAVVGEDGKLSFGVKANDTDGIDLDIKRDNLDVDNLDLDKLLKEIKQEVESQQKSHEIEDNSIEGRIERLEKENERLRKQLEQTRLEKQAMRTSKPIDGEKREEKKPEEKPSRRNSYDLFDKLLWDFGRFDKFLFN